MNELNQNLQGANKLITNSYQEMKTFIAKLKFYHNELKNNNAIHFPHLHDFDMKDKPISEYSTNIKYLLEEFEKRFAYLSKYEHLFNVFTCPFIIDINSVPENLQLELIDLQSNSEFKLRFDSMNKVEFYSKFITEDKFPNLKKLAMCGVMQHIFVSHFFSRLKLAKSRDRNRLTDKNLRNQLRCATTKLEVDIKKISNDINKQISH